MTKKGYDNTLVNIRQAMGALLKFIHDTKNKYKGERLVDKWTWFWKEME